MARFLHEDYEIERCSILGNSYVLSVCTLPNSLFQIQMHCFRFSFGLFSVLQLFDERTT